jgi:N-acetylneuraminic acid mutarotase
MGEQKTALTLLLILCLVLSTLPLVWAAEDSWTTLEPMPSARSDLGVAVVDGKIYAIGGHNGSHLSTNEMYDPLTDTWTTKTPMPTVRSSFGIAVVQDKIYVIGGVTGPSDSESSGITDVTEVYDPLSDTWETKTSMPTPRSSLCASAINNKIYLIGGSAYTNQSSPFYYTGDVNEVYDPATDTWTTKTRMPNSSQYYALAVDEFENKTYLISGMSVVAGPYIPVQRHTNQVYDSETDTWTNGKSIPNVAICGACGLTTGLFAPKRIYVIGGWNGTELGGSNMNQIYDPEKDEWTDGEPMPTVRRRFGIAVVNDVLYAIGGRYGEYPESTPLAVNEQYIPVDYIPEFPSWAPLIISLLAFMVVAFSYRRMFHTYNRDGRKR